MIPIDFRWTHEDAVLDWIACRHFGHLDWWFDSAAEAAKNDAGEPPLCTALPSLLRAYGGQLRRISISGLMFHISRCGSTITAKLLGNLPGTISLCEPRIFNQLLVFAENLPAQQRRSYLAALLRAFSSLRPHGSKYCVMKTTSHLVRFAPDFAAAAPNVPWLFITRKPIEVAVSLYERPSGIVRAWERHPERIGGWFQTTQADDPLTSLEQFIAAMLDFVLRQMLNYLENDSCGRILLVDYEQLPDVIWTTIRKHFHLPQPSKRELTKLERMATYDSESVGRPSMFERDSARKAARAPKALKRAVEERTGETFDLLCRAARARNMR